MNYGMDLAATGALTNMYRQDVLANNLANVNTVAYKPDVVYTRLRLPERTRDCATAISPAPSSCARASPRERRSTRPVPTSSGP